MSKEKTAQKWAFKDLSPVMRVGIGVGAWITGLGLGIGLTALAQHDDEIAIRAANQNQPADIVELLDRTVDIELIGGVAVAVVITNVGSKIRRDAWQELRGDTPASESPQLPETPLEQSQDAPPQQPDQPVESPEA